MEEEEKEAGADIISNSNPWSARMRFLSSKIFVYIHHRKNVWQIWHKTEYWVFKHGQDIITFFNMSLLITVFMWVCVCAGVCI